MILVVDRQSKTTFINLFKDLIDGVLQPSPNLVFAPVIELDEFPIDPLSIRLVDFGLFVALVKKGKLSSTGIRPISA